MIESLDRQFFFGIVLDLGNDRIVIRELDVGDEEWPRAVLEGFTTEQLAWIQGDRGPAVLFDFMCRHIDGLTSRYVSDSVFI